MTEKWLTVSGLTKSCLNALYSACRSSSSVLADRGVGVRARRSVMSDDETTAIDSSNEDTEASVQSSRSSTLEQALGAVRLGVGVALVIAPGWAGRIWVGPGSDGPGSKVFARAVGARDVALGARILNGARSGEPVGHWIRAGFAAD